MQTTLGCTDKLELPSAAGTIFIKSDDSKVIGVIEDGAMTLLQKYLE